MKSMRSLLLASVSCVLSAGLIFQSVRAADEPPQKPEDKPTKEPTEEQKNFESRQNKPLHFSGKLIALTPQEIAQGGDSSVIGKLVGEETMLVKPNDDTIKGVLMTLIGSEVTVNGHRRADGKYLNVIGIVPQLKGSPSVRAPGEL